MSPQCRMKRSTTAGSFFLSVVSVMTEISDRNRPPSRSIWSHPSLRAQDHAVRRRPAVAAAGAFRDEARQGAFERSQFDEFAANLIETTLGKLPRIGAGAAAIEQRQQCADLF